VEAKKNPPRSSKNSKSNRKGEASRRAARRTNRKREADIRTVSWAPALWFLNRTFAGAGL
jgi:hypothetical protein